MSKALHISKDLSLPIGIANKTICIFGKGGSGKSNLEVVLAEELYAAGIPTCIVDPADVHFGIKSARDGKSAGLPFIIFGGLHADVPIYPENGKLLADLFLDRGLYMVIVTQPWTGGERSKFMTDFANQLYKRGPEKEQRGSARVLLLEEAHEYVPLVPDKDGGTLMLGAMKRLYTVGRNYWIGFIAATRRPARMHTDLRNGADATAFFQIVGTQDRKAMTDYLGEMAEKDVRDEIVAHVAKLPVGTAYFYQPHEEPALQRVHFRYRNTLDTTTTEITAGHKTVKPVLAAVDLSKLGEAMEAAREKAKADDPKELRKTINELRTQMRKLESAKPQAPVAESKGKTETKVVEKKIVIEGTVTRLEKTLERAEKLRDSFQDGVGALNEEVAQIREALIDSRKINDANLLTAPAVRSAPARLDPHAAARYPKHIIKRDPKVVAASNGDAPNITGGALRILKVLASKPELQLTKPQLGTLARMKHTGGSFGTYMSRLRSAGFIADQGQYVSITDEGIDFIGADRLPEPQTSEEVLQQWLNTPAISGGAANMLTTLFNLRREGRGLSRAELAEAVNMEASGGSFGTYLSRLRSNGLIQEQGGMIYASDTLFINE